MTNDLSKAQLKQTIDRLDDQYLELVYKILRQFPPVSAEKTAKSGNFAENLHVLRRQIETEHIEVDMQVFEHDRKIDGNREIDS